jgi:hypothetical protein
LKRILPPCYLEVEVHCILTGSGPNLAEI